MGSIGRPSILIVPGACSTPEFYVPFVTAVREKGYEIEIVHIPSTNYEGRTKGLPAPSMSDDVALVQARIAELADVGKDVVLMTHSYGGTPGTQSVEGYGKKERLSRGLKGGVVGLAYMCSLIPELGQPAGSVQASMSEDEKPHMAVDVCSSHPLLVSNSLKTSLADSGPLKSRTRVGCTTPTSPGWHGSASRACPRKRPSTGRPGSPATRTRPSPRR